MGRIVAVIVDESWLFELFNCKFNSYSTSTGNSQHSLKIMIRYSTTSLRRIDPDLDFKGVWVEVELIHIGVEICLSNFQPYLQFAQCPLTL